MGGLAHVTFIGRLTKDPELRYTKAGVPFCTLGVAASETFVDGSGKRQERAVFFDSVCYNKQAEACSRYLTKGSMISGYGNLEMSLWKDQGGKQRKSLFVRADRIEFILSKGEKPSGQSRQEQSEQNEHTYTPEDAASPASSYADPEPPNEPF